MRALLARYSWIPAFIKVDKIEHRFDIRPIFKSSFAKPAFENRSRFVVPSAFAHELVPDLDLLEGRFSPTTKARFENLFVSATLLHAFDQLGVGHTEKRRASLIEAAA